MAQTSDRMSSIAAKYLNITGDDLGPGNEHMAADIRSMAASLLRQDEVKGLRRLIRKVLP